jgi:glucan-binding YG repeat protein
MKSLTKEWKRGFLLGIALIAACFCLRAGAVPVHAATPKNQYVKSGGLYYYYDKKGKLVKGLYTSPGGKLYYFDTKTGAAKAGIYTINGKRYVVNAKGAIQLGWAEYGGKRYYCHPKTGVIQTGWYKTSANTFYFGSDGAVRSGFQTIDGKKYYLTSYGRCVKNSFVTVSKKTYYLDNNGLLSTGWKTINGSRYYFNGSGVMQTGWLKLKDGTYYLNSKGVQQKGWVLLNGKYYCFRGSTGKLFTNGWVNKKYVGKDGYWVRNFESLCYSITGTSSVTVNQMVAVYQKRKVAYPTEQYTEGGCATIKKFCQMILQEATAEGIRAEVVFSQIMLETNWLQFGGDVDIKQYNFAGIGATGNGVPGNSFKNVRTGIRATVQHLKAYANTASLKNTCVDPRFAYVTRGNAPYVEWLGAKENPNGTGWAASAGYGFSIRKIIAELTGTTYTQP